MKALSEAAKRRTINIIFFLAQIVTGCVLLAIMDLYDSITISLGFIVFSVITGLMFCDKYELMSSLLDKVSKKIVFLLLCLYSGFAMVGNRAVVYPVGNRLSVKDLIELLLAFVWSVQAVSSFFFLTDIFKRRCVYQEKEKALFDRPVAFAATVFTVCIIPLVISLIAFNPGISDSDSSYSIYFAKNLLYCIDWFPPFYYIYLRMILSIMDSIYAIVVSQFLFFIFVILEFSFLLRRLKVKDGFIIILAFLLSINPANMLNLTSIWKDVQYVCSFLWLIVVLVRLSTGLTYKGRYEKVLYAELVLSLVGTWYFRKNGIVPVAMLLAALLIYGRKNKKVLISCVAAVVVIVFVQAVLYPALHVRSFSEDSNKKGDAYIGLGQDMRGVYHSEGVLSDEALDVVKQMENDDNTEYNPTYYGNWKSNMNVDFFTFIKAYIDTFIKNPKSLIDSVFCRNDGIWSLYHGDFGDVLVIDYHGTADGTTVGGGHQIFDRCGNPVEDKWNDYAPVHKDNFLTKVLAKYTYLSANFEIMKVFLWRSGFHVLILISAAVLLFFSKKKMILPYICIAGQILSLVLACGWSVFRYYWPINLGSVFVVVISCALAADKEK